MRLWLGKKRKDGEGVTDTQNGSGGFEKGSCLRGSSVLRVVLTAGRSELEGRQISSASMANGVEQDLASKRLHSR